MPTLRQQLAQRDPIELHIVAQNQGILLEDASGPDLLARLTAQMLQAEQIRAVWDDLAPDVQRTLAEMAHQPHGLPVPIFQRRYGELRRIGPGRLPTEQPWQQPTGPGEILWYLGWLTRGFRRRPEGVLDVISLPDDLLPLLPLHEVALETTPAALMPVPAPAQYRELGALLLDDLGTVLAYVQNHQVWLRSKSRWRHEDWQRLLPRLRLSALRQQPLEMGGPLHLLIFAARKLGLLVTQKGRQRFGKALRPWLEQSRQAQLASLFQVWQQAHDWNDLCWGTGLRCLPGAWRNDSLQARSALLAQLAQVEPGQWFHLDALVTAIYQQNPDFQRPDGHYDTWYIEDETGTALRGFKHWHQVEGRLIRHLWQGPLFWLGAVALDADGQRWQLTQQGHYFLTGDAPPEPQQAAVLSVQKDYSLVLTPGISLWDRLRVARFAFWQASEPQYRYQITRRGMQRARKHGISGQRIVNFLMRASDNNVPETVRKTLESFQL
jgi:hypothetical protein